MTTPPPTAAHRFPSIVSRVLLSSRGNSEYPFSRGACSLLKYEIQSFSSVHVLTAAHVALPHRYPNVFPSHETKFGMLGDRHMKCGVMTQDSEGRRTGNHTCRFGVRRHPLYNIASIRLEDESPLLKVDDPPTVLEHVDVARVIQQGDSFDVMGFDVVEDDQSEENFRMVPKVMSIRSVAEFTHQTFGPLIIAETSEPPPTGMAGAAVVRDGVLCGVFMGRVATMSPQNGDVPVAAPDLDTTKAWQGMGCFMQASHFVEFLRRCEQT